MQGGKKFDKIHYKMWVAFSGGSDFQFVLCISLFFPSSFDNEHALLYIQNNKFNSILKSTRIKYHMTVREGYASKWALSE